MPTTHFAISKLVAQTWARNEFEARLTDRVAPSHCDPLVRSFLFHPIGGGCGGAGGLGGGGTNYDIAAASAPLHSTRRETKIDQDQRELPTPDRRRR